MEDRKTNLKSLPEMYRPRTSESPREEKASALRQPKVTAEERQQLIARAAYFRAERRGFLPGSEMEDWLAAEAEIERIHPKGGVRRSA